MGTNTVIYNEDKLKELILYIATVTEEDESFGATKLNKALFYSDFFWYSQTGRPITGADYMKLPYGPAPYRLKPVRQSLTMKGEAHMDRSAFLGRFRVQRLIPDRLPNLSLFDEEEIDFVDKIIEWVADGSAGMISTASHDEVGWQLSKDGETIPYFTVWLSFCPPTADDELRAEELFEKLVGA